MNNASPDSPRCPRTASNNMGTELPRIGLCELGVAASGWDISPRNAVEPKAESASRG